MPQDYHYFGGSTRARKMKQDPWRTGRTGSGNLGRGGRAALDVDAAREVLARTGAALVTVPYDRHLAAATPVEPGRVAEATAIEATRLAGYALQRAGQPSWGPGPR